MTSEPSKRGALVVVEGLDRAGKSSQCLLLQDKLKSQGIPVKYVKFPDRSTPIGQIINAYLTGQARSEDHAVHLLFSANRWEAVDSIISDLKHGVTVIIDRYSYSGAVYSAAKDIPTLSLEWCYNMEVGLPRPDVLVFLHISPEAAAKRGGFGEERYETTKMQARVRELFEELFSKIGQEYLCTIDAGRSVEEVANDVSRPVLDCIGKLNSASPLGTLEPLPA